MALSQSLGLLPCLMKVLIVAFINIGQASAGRIIDNENIVSENITCMSSAVAVGLNTKSFLYVNNKPFIVMPAAPCNDTNHILMLYTGLFSSVTSFVFNDTVCPAMFQYKPIYGPYTKPIAYTLTPTFIVQEVTLNCNFLPFGTTPTADPPCNITGYGQEYSFHVQCLFIGNGHFSGGAGVANSSVDPYHPDIIPVPSNSVELLLVNLDTDKILNTTADPKSEVARGTPIRALMSIVPYDKTYKAILPDYCYFADQMVPNVAVDPSQSIVIIANSCPVAALFSEMSAAFTQFNQWNESSYSIDFKNNCWNHKKQKSERDVEEMMRNGVRRVRRHVKFTKDGNTNGLAQAYEHINVTGGTSGGNIALIILAVFLALLAAALVVFLLCCCICGCTVFGVGIRQKKQEYEESQYHQGPDIRGDDDYDEYMNTNKPIDAYRY